MTNKEIYEALRSDIQKNGIRTIPSIVLDNGTKVDFVTNLIVEGMGSPADLVETTTAIIESKSKKNYNKVKNDKEN